ncbi:hypothetical protein FRC16_010320 [Serendipita sp. 398]|nr:hypothetical protein FRC16_010320 [Serendipita sp. 398]
MGRSADGRTEQPRDYITFHFGPWRRRRRSPRPGFTPRDGWLPACLSLSSSSFSMQPSNHVHLFHHYPDSHILIIHPCPDSVYVFPSSRLPFIRLFLSVLLVLLHFSSIHL